MRQFQGVQGKAVGRTTSPSGSRARGNSPSCSRVPGSCGPSAGLPVASPELPTKCIERLCTFANQRNAKLHPSHHAVSKQVVKTINLRSLNVFCCRRANGSDSHAWCGSAACFAPLFCSVCKGCQLDSLRGGQLFCFVFCFAVAAF